MTAREELCRLARRHVVGPVSDTAISGLRIYCSDSPKPVDARLLYAPMVCIMLQGEKRVLLGSESFRYTPEHYLISCVHLPVTGTVAKAHPNQPYMALSLALDMELLAAILLEFPAAELQPASRALGIGLLTSPMLDAFLRMVRLLEEPAVLPLLAPLISREIIVRLISSSEGSMLRQIATQHSHASGIARALRSIRKRYAESFDATELAHVAGMSLPTFNRNFRVVTGMSALQYQKQIRLLEARRQMFAQSADAASVGFDVGYASPSQFSREYARNFGRPPQEDAAWLRSQTSAHAWE